TRAPGPAGARRRPAPRFAASALSLVPGFIELELFPDRGDVAPLYHRRARGRLEVGPVDEAHALDHVVRLTRVPLGGSQPVELDVVERLCRSEDSIAGHVLQTRSDMCKA